MKAWNLFCLAGVSFGTFITKYTERKLVLDFHLSENSCHFVNLFWFSFSGWEKPHGLTTNSKKGHEEHYNTYNMVNDFLLNNLGFHLHSFLDKAKINTYTLIRAELLITLCYETPCSCQDLNFGLIWPG